MKNNREIKIAAVVAALMIIICVVIVLSTNVDSGKIDLQVYKHIETETQKGYIQCEIPNSILLELNTEFKKAKQLSTKSEVEPEKINGTYKIVSGKTSFAFDDDKGIIYNIEENKLYSFDSSLYTLVTSVCK